MRKRTLALATVSGAALLAAGSLTPAAQGGSVLRSDVFTPVPRARPVPVNLTPAAYARPASDTGPARTASSPLPAADPAPADAA